MSSGVSLVVAPQGCLDEQTVLDLMEGRLSETSLSDVERHLGSCAACTELLSSTGPILLEQHLVSSSPGAAAGDDEPVAARAQPAWLPIGGVLRDTYTIVRRIGRGGMGEVYEARHARLTGRYAIKVLPQEFAEDAAVLSRFRREAQISSGLQHPNIVQVIDFHETDDGRPYLVMEYLDGEDLAAWMRRHGPVTLAEALPLIDQIAAALGAVHRRGIVHRDVKPQNVFVIPQERGKELIKLVDFGLSKAHARSLVVTRQPMILGTPRYMSPEQALGRVEEVGPPTDQFALAAIVYEMLTGLPAFAGDGIWSVIYRIVHEDPPASPQVGAGVADVLKRALSKSADERYDSLASFVEALHAVAAAPGVPRVVAAPVAARPPAPPAARAASRAAIVVGVLAAAAAVGILVLRLRPRPGPSAAPPPTTIAEPAPAPAAVVPPPPLPAPAPALAVPPPAPTAESAAAIAPSRATPVRRRPARTRQPEAGASAPAAGEQRLYEPPAATPPAPPVPRLVETIN